MFVDTLRYAKVAELYVEGGEGGHEYILFSSSSVRFCHFHACDMGWVNERVPQALYPDEQCHSYA